MLESAPIFQTPPPSNTASTTKKNYLFSPKTALFGLGAVLAFSAVALFIVRMASPQVRVVSVSASEKRVVPAGGAQIVFQYARRSESKSDLEAISESELQTLFGNLERIPGIDLSLSGAQTVQLQTGGYEYRRAGRVVLSTIEPFSQVKTALALPTITIAQTVFTPQNEQVAREEIAAVAAEKATAKAQSFAQQFGGRLGRIASIVEVPLTESSSNLLYVAQPGNLDLPAGVEMEVGVTAQFEIR